MKTILSVLVFLSFTWSSCAQMKSIKQAKAYYYIRIPGNIPVDEKNNPIELKADTVTNIYLEVDGSLPEWKTAWYKGGTYSLIETVLKEDTQIIGKKLTTGDNIMIKKAKKNQLVILSLEQTINSPVPQKISGNEILLKGVLNRKTFFYKIKSPVQIASPEFM